MRLPANKLQWTYENFQKLKFWSLSFRRNEEQEVRVYKESLERDNYYCGIVDHHPAIKESSVV